MKKILISAVALIIGVTALNAQSPWFLGGEARFHFDQDNEKTKTTKFSVIPQVGYMFNDNWGLTLDLGYSMKTVKPENESSVTEYTTLGAAIGGIYKYEILNKFFYAPTLKAGYARDTEHEIDSIGADFNFLRFELRPACHWGINFNFGGLSYLNESPKEGESINSFDLSVGNAYAVGFTFYF